jgi:hypothetical protein
MRCCDLFHLLLIWDRIRGFEIPPKARACLAQSRGDAEKDKGKRIGLTQSRNARNGRQRKKRKNIASHRDAEPTEKGVKGF